VTVHNHGSEDGEGLACPETRLPGGQLKGRCLMEEVPLTDGVDGPVVGMATFWEDGRLVGMIVTDEEFAKKISSPFTPGMFSLRDENWIDNQLEDHIIRGED
jgi:hypothetical protein